MSKALTIRDHLQSDLYRNEIGKILPAHVDPKRWVKAAYVAILRNPKLAECDLSSFFLALSNLGQWGLFPDGRHAHLIPFRNNKKGIVECQLLIDYKGIVDLIDRSGLVSKIHCDKVCEHDEFTYETGEVRHRINFAQPRGQAYAYYCIIEKRDGGKKCEVMTLEEINAVRKRSLSGNSGPWVTDFDEMAKKTVFKRAAKWVSISAELREIIDHEDTQETRIASQPVSRAFELLTAAANLDGETIDATATPTETEECQVTTE